MDRKYLAILLAAGLLIFAADHSEVIAENLNEITQKQVKEVEGPKDTGSATDKKKDDWQFELSKIYDTEPRNVTKDESAYLARTATASLWGHTYTNLASSVVFNPVTAGIIFLSQGPLASFGEDAASDIQYQQSLGRSGDLGLKTGGAQDVNNFRENIENGYLPLNKDISYEGLLHEYYFDTGQKQECDRLFCPSYSKAVTEDPLSNQTEYYTTVGLNSELTQEEFERKKLNLVVVMDISGSMGSSFDRYYYDRFGKRHEVENYTEKKKIEIAKESLKGLTEHLRPDDRFGIVLFNSNSYKAKPLRKVGKTDMEAIRQHIMEDIKEGGGTNMESGFSKGTEMLEQYKNADQEEYENRMIFMTDAMPNIGTTSDEGLMSMAEENAGKNIHTTFVGMGVDFNTDLVDSITSIRGANYYSVHSSEQFKNRMDKNFEYMVTPLVYDMKLELESDSYRIEKVYGSTAAEESTGEIMKVNTLFPSPKKKGKTKGGVVLAQLEKTGNKEDIKLRVEYTERNGKQQKVEKQIQLGNQQPEYFQNSGIRKAVLLTRYADLMKNWIDYERDQLENRPEPRLPERYRKPGIEPHPESGLSEQERTSKDLTVSDRYEERIRKFRSYFKKESEEIGDSTLEQETKIMNQILAEN